jgi:hypothetical protein
MQDNFNTYLDRLEQTLPELLTSEDLVKTKIFRSQNSLAQARRHGFSPPYIKLPNRKVLYLKADIIKWFSKLYIADQSA